MYSLPDFNPDYVMLFHLLLSGRKKAKDDPRYAKFFKMKRLVRDNYFLSRVVDFSGPFDSVVQVTVTYRR